jgi:polyphosphate glucokinase
VTKKQPAVLVIDVGGTNVKIHAGKQKEPVKIPSGPKMSARQMVAAVRKAAADWKYTSVSIGYPGPVLHDKPVTEPHNLGSGWVRFDYQKAFGCPVQLVNDAAMQALGSYEGGRMLFLGLGTGLGSAMIVDGQLEPMELAHLPYKKGSTYEDYVGLRGLKRLGKKKWRRNVAEVIDQLKKAMAADYVVLGGGNVKLLKKLPPDTRLGSNMNAFVGGARLWQETKARSTKPKKPKRAAQPKATAKLKPTNAPSVGTQFEPAADEFVSVELATL